MCVVGPQLYESREQDPGLLDYSLPYPTRIQDVVVFKMLGGGSWCIGCTERLDVSRFIAIVCVPCVQVMVRIGGFWV
jgi:hypothetical protein